MLKDYILLIDKPSFMTSQDCLVVIKKRLKLNKIGHTGTLDPLATGLMVVLVNEATKISDFILKSDKVYIAKMQLFLKTDTGDITGKIIESKPHLDLKESEIVKALEFYNNRQYEQIIPAYAAVKINGKKLYEYARENIPVELPKRKVYIKSLKLISFNNDLVTFEVVCSKGTYVRALVTDIARILHTSATLTYLRRIHQSGFDLSNALNLDVINEETVSKNHISIYDGVKNIMPAIVVDNSKSVIDGKPLVIDSTNEPYVLVVNSEHLPLAIYRNQKNNLYVSQRGFKCNEDIKIEKSKYSKSKIDV
ncbi:MULTISPECIES: tRNA pseudouridine(55) synthase TruB [unclassified Spiroplasma]|uniref:tRNA pseudouridine(55) synthase TruB n=1 Tax=unclassified Spiroplasma TaxID=2637901 RepID=UPI001DFE7828|nr:tRNA pseudouridine(55) synthase TruB [Spiroplasma endosymbiont of Lariophagus distinguendus]MBP1525112.1 tRNA pseudouridine(55) synthase TruB [Spiroplasma ixodetis]MBP1526723.1 tRNA pseudouridine(55) synthase TruB [Spiroplasma ixodetis]MBP1527845.1 tRNA pseudouridine(55) synthase TruB [Spiroplasma ixodetis]